MEKKPNDKKLTRKEKRKERRQKKEVARLKRISRFRPFKNLLWWLTGVITPIILLVIAIGAGTFLIPISTYIKWAGGKPEDYVNEEISDKSVYGSIANISDYTMEDVPAIKLLVEALSDALSGIQINGTPLFDINRDKLEGLKDNKLVGDFAGFFTEYTSCLSVVATISCLGIDFGALGQLSSMNTFEEVKEDEQLNLYLSDGTPVEVPQLYYFDANQLVSMAIILDPPVAQPQTADPNDPDSNDPVDPEPSNPVDPEPSDPVEPDNPDEPTEEPTEPAGDYRRLFNNDGTLVSDLSTLTPEQLDELVIYYPALNSVPMVDFMAVFGPRIKTTSVNSLVGAFTGSTGDGLLDKILGDKTIASLGGLTTSDIYLVDFLDPPSEEMPTDPEAEDYQEKLNAYNKNRDIYDILMGATGKQTYAEISLADLSNMDINAVSLSVILDAPTTDTILEKPTDESAPDYEEQLKAYTESYNGYHQNRKLYDILLDAAGIEFVSYETYNELTIEHLRSINIDNVKLSSVLEAPAEEMPTDPEAPDYQEKLDAYNKNRDIYDILKAATGKETYAEITISALSGLDINLVNLSIILDPPTSDEKVEKPTDTEAPDYQEKLDAYNAYNQNRKLYSILMDAAGKTKVDPETGKVLEYSYKDFEALTVQDLNNINIDSVKLSSVLELPAEEMPTDPEAPDYQEKLDAYNKNRDIYDILKSATGCETYEEITIASLSSLDINAVELSIILDPPTSDEKVEKPTDTEAPDYQEKLDAYNAYHHNRQLYSILMDAAGKTKVDPETGKVLEYSYKDFEELTVQDLNSINVDNVKLSSVIDPPSEEMPEVGDPDYDAKLTAYNKNRDIYDILKGATGKPYAEISIADLSDMNINAVALSTILDPPTSDVKVEMPTDTEDPEYQEKLDAYNAYHQNRKLYDILLDAAGITYVSCETYKELTVEHLNNIDINKVKLNTVIEAPTTDTILEKPTDESDPEYEAKLKAYNDSYNAYHKNRTLYNILLDSAEIEFVSCETYKELTIGHLQSVNIDVVRISTILDAPTSDVKVEMPEDGDPDYDAKLEAYNAYHKNRTLYKVLLDAAGKTKVDAETGAILEYTCEDFNTLTIKDLNSIDIDNVKLPTIIDAPTSDVKVEMPEVGEEDYDAKLEAYNAYHQNRKLYDILLDSAGIDYVSCQTYNQLTLRSLQTVDIDSVKVSTILEAPTTDEIPVKPTDESAPDFEEKMAEYNQAYNQYNKNRKLYSILMDAAGKTKYDEQTGERLEYSYVDFNSLIVRDLNGIDVDNVKLVSVIEAPSDYKPTLGEENYQEKLAAYNKNRDIYEILKEVSNKNSFSEITLADLSGMQVDDVSLSTILDAPTSDVKVEMPTDPNAEDYNEKLEEYNAYHHNRKLYDILLDAAGIEFVDCTTYKTLKVKDLDGIDVDNIRLVSVIEPPSNEKPEIGAPDYQEKLDAYNRNREVYNILMESTGNTSYEDIKLGDITDMETSNISLVNILDAPTTDTPAEKPVEGEENYDVKLAQYNAYHKNRKLYTILMDASGKAKVDAETGNQIEYSYVDFNQLKVSDLNSFDINKVKLTNVLEAPSNEKPDINDPNYETKLAAYNKNRDIYNILVDCTGKTDYDAITLADLSNMETDEVRLASVIEPPSNYKPTLGEENYQEKLEAYNKNREVYNILMESTGNTSYESIKLGDISKMDTGNVTLANIIDAPTSDEKVEKPLDPDAPDYQEQLDKYNAYNQNRKLYDILLDSAGIKFTSCEDYKKLKVNSLNDFDVQSIKLSTVMGSSSNSIIQSLIDEDNAHVNEEDYVPVTLGTIGDRINGLLVKDVYNVEVFTTDVNKANFSNIKYNETDTPYYKTEDEEGNVTYSTTGSGEEYYVIGYYKTVDFNGIVRYVTEKPEGGDDTLYYISKDSSVWLFMLFDSFDIDQSKFDDTTGQLVYKGTGVAETYIEKNITIKGLKDRISVVSVNIMNASVRQICDCGMLDGEYDKIYGLSFVEAIKELNRLMSLMG